MKYVFLSLFFLSSFFVQSNCTLGQFELIVHIVPDQFPSEIHWNVHTSNGVFIASGDSESDTLCIDSSLGCVVFTITDDYGDGIYSPGYYQLIVNGQIIQTGGNYGTYESTSMNCNLYETCSTAQLIDTGSFVAPYQNSWYLFVADTNGTFEVSTCDTSNNCDTRIWVYNQCPSSLYNYTNMQTTHYNDSANCGNLAVLNAVFVKGDTILIRVGSPVGGCDSIHFSIQYSGPVVGCMDLSACNYNPIATVSDVCYYYPDTMCGLPDLALDKGKLFSTISLSTYESTFCEVQEGCVNGYGTREVVVFSTKIDNIGEADYYIGDPYLDSSQFSYNNCHQHPHYEGYAKYTLYDVFGNLLPIGSKTGFCVIDLYCPQQDMYKYSCNNMGISAGCTDEYNVSVGCQHVDITQVDTGHYILKVEVNWDRSPDKLGVYERTYDNNYAEICLYIGHNGTQRYILVDTLCAPYMDCMGVVNGSAVKDCNGNCNGLEKYGDLNINQSQQMDDVALYVQNILDASLNPSSCTDLNADTTISVFDAALLQNCVLNGTPNNDNCSFPLGVVNPNFPLAFSIQNIDFTQNSLDIYIHNPLSKVRAYEFDLKGITILSVQNLVTDPLASIEPEYNVGGKKIVGIAYTDSSISKNFSETPLCKVFFTLDTGLICFDQIIDVVSSDYENIPAYFDPCAIITNADVRTQDVSNFWVVYPNPSKGVFTVDVSYENAQSIVLYEVYNVLQQKVTQGTLPNKQKSELNLAQLERGTYYMVVKDESRSFVQRIVIQ